MVAFAWRVRNEREGARADRAAHHLFAFSILYLFVLFAVLLVEGGLGGSAVRLVMTWTKSHRQSSSASSRSAVAARASIAIALALGRLVILFYVVTLVKGPGVLNRPL
jgi:hypothetical protein